ncbi:hypothetical protein [Bradyrhizobium erythrophlei]|uniref:hypothetical protein n=1 Tax=Bradyrhizobium erythrophlei TaxID=1437360 RepID=UPI001FDA7112|nr:hypothetical protein [Bradyrhizobium erythrophlei]
MTLKAPQQDDPIVGDIIDDQKARRRRRIILDSTGSVIFGPQDGDAFGLEI